MALSVTEINAITERLFMPKLVDNIFKSNALFNRMKKKNYILKDGGSKIVQPISYAQTTAAGFFSGADLLTTTANDQITAAEFDWTTAYANITIDNTEELKNSGKAQMVDLVKSKMELAEMTLADVIGTAMFNVGGVSKTFDGLRMICNTSGTYGGISKTDYSWWRGQLDATSTVVTASGSFQSLLGDCTIDTDRPTIAVTTQDIFDDLVASLQDQQRFTDTDTAKAGFINIVIGGVPVIVDSHAPAGHLFMLNERYLNVVAHKAANFKFDGFVKPVNQNLKAAKIYWMGSLVCSKPSVQGMMTSVA